MFDQLHLQELNDLKKKIADGFKTNEAALYNSMKYAQKAEIRYLRNLHYDNFDNTNLTDVAGTTAVIQDGALRSDPKDTPFTSNGAVVQANTAFPQMKIARSDSVFGVYQSVDDVISVALVQNGRVLAVLPTFEGSNPSFVTAPQRYFYCTYDKLDSESGKRKVYYRKVYLDASYSADTVVDTGEKPQMTIDSSGNLHFFYETDKSGVKNIAHSVNGTINDITTKATPCINVKVAQIFSKNKIAVFYEDVQNGYTQICYKFIDNLVSENRITSTDKTQKNIFVVSGLDEIKMVSESDMNNNYLDVWKTTIQDLGFENEQVTTATADISSPKLTINEDGRETIYWIDNTKLYVQYENVTESLSDTLNYDVSAMENQLLFLVKGTDLQFKEFDTISNESGVIYTHTPDQDSVFISTPYEIGDSYALDLYISKKSDDIQVKPYISFGAASSQWIPLDYVDTRDLIENREEHYRLYNVNTSIVRVKMELSSVDKYSDTAIVIDYGFTHY
ncbi:hypothetical protein ABEX78_32355 [Priestia megaterium]